MGCLAEFKKAYKTLAETTLHIMKKAPEGKEDFKPSIGEFMTLGELMHHQGDCQKYFRLTLEEELRELDRNFDTFLGNHPSSDKAGAIKHFQEEYGKVMAILDKMTEEEFHEKVVYFWTVNDEALPFITYNVFEHNASHKYQLFMYLKMMGLPNLDSFALAGEDAMPKEQIIEMYKQAHAAYDQKHGVKA